MIELVRNLNSISYGDRNGLTIRKNVAEGSISEGKEEVSEASKTLNEEKLTTCQDQFSYTTNFMQSNSSKGGKRCREPIKADSKFVAFGNELCWISLLIKTCNFKLIRLLESLDKQRLMVMIRQEEEAER